MWEPDGGNVDPSGVTNAYAAGARLNGAEIHRFTPVIGTEQNSDGTWNVRTDKGDIHTEWIVNAAGLSQAQLWAMKKNMQKINAERLRLERQQDSLKTGKV